MLAAAHQGMEKPQPWLIHSLHPGAVRGDGPTPPPSSCCLRALLVQSLDAACAPPATLLRHPPRSSTCRLTGPASTPRTWAERLLCRCVSSVPGSSGPLGPEGSLMDACRCQGRGDAQTG